MKILLLCGSSYGIGTFVRARELARWLVEFGHEVVLGYKGNRKFRAEIYERDGVKEIGIPSFLNRIDLDTMASPIGHYWIKRYIKKNRFDVVHGFEHYSIVHSAGIYAVKRWNSLYISDWADWFSSADERTLFKVPGYRTYMSKKEESVKKNAHGVTVISRELEKRAAALHKADRVMYLPGGAPVDRLQPMNKSDCRNKIAISQSEMVYGYLGSFLADELIPFLNAFKEISNEIEARFIVVGKICEALKDYAIAEGIEDRVIFTGYVSDEEVNQYLCACDAFVLPLRDTDYNRSRWPNKIGDYMASGRPVICSNVGEMKQVLMSAEIGIGVGDCISEMYKAMNIYVLDEKKKETEGKNARKLAEESFAWELLTRRLENFYYDLLEKR
ncbi:hypothetical protein R50073_26900 [Maricurvus nonylphenolicus]|uniref:glycosyltransferase family 4 protein n=1 Tax=Maricurvus nonylphenolicus TaxID=1008307 RepID=UPI0036F2EB23